MAKAKPSKAHVEQVGSVGQMLRGLSGQLNAGIEAAKADPADFSLLEALASQMEHHTAAVADAVDKFEQDEGTQVIGGDTE